MTCRIKKFFLLLFSICSILTKNIGQHNSLNQYLHTVNERTYLQFMRGNLPDRKGNVTEDRANFMEAQIAPFYFIRFGEGSKFTLCLSPKIILRMAGGESFPIKTPSFMPTIAAFHAVNASSLSSRKSTKWLIKPEHQLFILYRIGHHSNGQKDEFFVKGTKRINFSTRNFSTEFAEIGLQWTDMTGGSNGFSINGRITFEQQLDVTRETDLEELYYHQRILLENEFNFTTYLHLSTKVDYMIGNGSRFDPKASFQISAEFTPFRQYSDLSFFLRYFTGPDYYNIRYFSHQNFIGMGIRANPGSNNAISL